MKHISKNNLILNQCRLLTQSTKYNPVFCLDIGERLTYHGHTTKFSLPETISIEHILPKTPDLASQWVSDFPEQEREKWTDRLGNLILLSRRKNTAQSNLDYQKKKEKYFKNNVELFSNSIRIFQSFSTWKLDDLKKNHGETLVKLLAYGITMSDDDLKRALV